MIHIFFPVDPLAGSNGTAGRGDIHTNAIDSIIVYQTKTSPRGTVPWPLGYPSHPLAVPHLFTRLLFLQRPRWTTLYGDASKTAAGHDEKALL